MPLLWRCNGRRRQVLHPVWFSVRVSTGIKLSSLFSCDASWCEVLPRLRDAARVHLFYMRHPNSSRREVLSHVRLQAGDALCRLRGDHFTGSEVLQRLWCRARTGSSACAAVCAAAATTRAGLSTTATAAYPTVCAAISAAAGSGCPPTVSATDTHATTAGRAGTGASAAARACRVSSPGRTAVPAPAV